MVFLGIDYGLKRIGLAISEGVLATPLPTLAVKNKRTALQEVLYIIDTHKVGRIVFGLPTPDRIGAKKFADDLAKLTSAPFTFVDETLTSQVALSKLKAGGKKRIKKGNLDAVSAAILLQEVLDEGNV